MALTTGHDCECAIGVIDDLLVGAGLGALVKRSQLDPLNGRDFVVLVERMARTLWRIAEPNETAAKSKALTELDLDWKALTVPQRNAAIEAAGRAMQATATGILPRLDLAFEAESVKITRGTKFRAVRRWELGIEQSLSTTDERIADAIRSSTTNYVTDAYGRRNEAFSEMAREVVARGVSQGLDRNAIGQQLHEKMGGSDLARGKPYFTTVAAQFMARGRGDTLISTFSEARIAKFQWLSVMDERTTLPCRMLNGRVFSTSYAMATVERSIQLTRPEDISEARPMLQEGRDDEGQYVYYEKNGSEHIVGRVVRSGVGNKDDAGEWSNVSPISALEGAGAATPPAHFRCRSTIIPYLL